MSSFETAASQSNGMSETVFVRQWKWLNDIYGNNHAVWCLYTKFITILQLWVVYFPTFQCLFWKLFIRYFEKLISHHLSPLTLEVVGAPQMTLQQYLSILPCLALPSGNLQTPFPSIPWCYLPISSSVFLSFLLLSLSLAELSSPYQRILRCGHTIWVSVSLPWLGDHHALQLHSGFCCEPPRSSHGLCRKCSEVSYSISSQGLGSFSRFLLPRSSSHRHKGRWIRWASASA